MAAVAIESLTKRFGATVAVDAVDLEVRDGELLTLLGPSGSGKTTMLRLVAGYIDPDAGRIVIGGREVQSLPPEKRDIGMVFQGYALFPHRNVFGNVAFGLERRGLERREIDRRVEEALEMVRLDGLGARRTDELSGGQQQRVALARALVIRPTVLLLDEPLSNLDAKLRDALRLEIRRIQRALAITTLLVTHDQEEALTLSDRIAVLGNGALRQLGSPEDLYHRPQNRFVAEFIGRINLFPVDRLGEGRYRTASGEVLRGPAGAARALLGVRPEAIRVTSDPQEPANRLMGRVVSRRFLGEVVELGVELEDGAKLVARCSETEAASAALDEPIALWWPVEATTIVPD